MPSVVTEACKMPCYCIAGCAWKSSWMLWVQNSIKFANLWRSRDKLVPLFSLWEQKERSARFGAIWTSRYSKVLAFVAILGEQVQPTFEGGLQKKTGFRDFLFAILDDPIDERLRHLLYDYLSLQISMSQVAAVQIGTNLPVQNFQKFELL